MYLFQIEIGPDSINLCGIMILSRYLSLSLGAALPNLKQYRLISKLKINLLKITNLSILVEECR